MRTGRRWAIVVIAVIAAAGCTTLQTPEVLNPGETALGFGAAVMTDVGPIPTVALFARRGLADRLDVGIKVEAPFPPSLALDMKYQIVRREPWLAVVDLGAAVSNNDNDDYGFGIVPMVLGGTKRFYAGAKVPIMWEFDGLDLWIDPQIIAGAAFGERVKILTEVAVHLYGPTVHLALGLQWTLGDE